MAYEVTASRKRPRNFDTLVGQEFVTATLLNALKTRRIAHAYLFSGPRGVGKTSTARILARALNCPDESKLGTAEGFDYPGAEEISRGVAMDVIEIDGASNTSVNDVRAIKDEVLFPPQSSRYKIYIIDEVHMLSNSAFNALLKTIEEPPHYIIFIFATTEIHKVPATIRSRCQQFNFRLIPIEEIIQLLGEAADEIGVKSDEDALFWIARESTGSMRDAYTLFDQVASFSEGHITLEKIKEKLGLLGIDELNGFTELIIGQKEKETLEYLDGMFSAGISVEQLIIDLSDYFRGLLFAAQGVNRDGLLGHPLKSYSDKVIHALKPTQLEKILEMLLQAYRDIRYTVNARLELEILISKITRISNYLEPEELVERLHNLKHEIARMPEKPSQVVSQSVSRLPDNQTRSAENSLKSQEMSAAFVSGTSDTEDEISESPAHRPETVPQEPENGDSPGSPILNDQQWQQLIQRIQEESQTLAATLSSAVARKQDGENLTIQFNTAMHAGTARQDVKFIADSIQELFGIHVVIDITHSDIQEEEDQEDPDVAMVKKVFRGELLN